MTLSIIMPVYLINEELCILTKEAWRSIVDSNLPKETELILIDNGSKFNTMQTCDIVIKNKTNLGYAPAVYQGEVLAKGKYLAIANNDIRVTPNWWEVAEEILESDEKIGSVHYRMIPYEQPFNLGSETWVGGKERWCTSSFFVVRNGLGTHDPKYGKGSYDDYDFWHNVRAQGYKQAYTNKASYQHKFSSTFNAIGQDERDKEDALNYEYYKSKFGEYPDIQFANEFPDQMNEAYHPFP